MHPRCSYFPARLNPRTSAASPSVYIVALADVCEILAKGLDVRGPRQHLVSVLKTSSELMTDGIA
jgi:hypothetical protein